MSKVWRDVNRIAPPEVIAVLAKTMFEDVAFVAMFDGDTWVEYHTGDILHDIEFWMPIPIYPNE